MRHAHDLYVRCIAKAINGQAKNVDQSTISKGTTYFSRQWTPAKSRSAEQNFNRSYRETIEGDLEKLRQHIETVDP